MFVRSNISLLKSSSQCKIIPIVESRVQFTQVLDSSQINSILLRHCNLFDLTNLLNEAHKRAFSVFVYIDHIDGIHADFAGLRYLAESLHVTGIVSNHPRTLSLGKDYGLEVALESVDTHCVDLLDISPGLVTTYIAAHTMALLPLPFIASGLIHTPQQVRAVLQTGALGVAVSRPELWL
jgi:glycerol uptake operon antiterminator